ncbi:MAG: argininosuccinate lyase [Pseudomonadota bacterium]
MSGTRLWDKGAALDARVLAFTAGEDHRLDARLVEYDARASASHARMLHQAGYLSATDTDAIVAGLAALARAHANGEWAIELDDEDVHTALEKHLTAAIGEAGKRVHLGRSRNDQVLAALRLYLKDVVDALDDGIADVCRALSALIERDGAIALPGYTHLQQAMPSSVALWAAGFVAELNDDQAALAAAKRRIDKNPLGSAAGYGTPALTIDRAATAAELGFASVHEPVTAVQLSRGKAEAAVLFEIVQTQNDLSRLAADLLLYYTQEFAFVRLPDSLTTGSSIMPQKRNPDVLELIRAAPATAIGALNEALIITTKLTSGYHRDLQRLKAPLFRGIDLALESLALMSAMLDGVRFVAENIHVDPATGAAEAANRLVAGEGLSFRDAYRQIAARYRNEHD